MTRLAILAGSGDLPPRLAALREDAARLLDAGVTLHLSEVKGPVMDRLRRGALLDHLTGKVFLSQHDAVEALRPAGGETRLSVPSLGG